MRDFFHDLAAAFLAGLAASAGLFAALFIAGFLLPTKGRADLCPGRDVDHRLSGAVRLRGADDPAPGQREAPGESAVDKAVPHLRAAPCGWHCFPDNPGSGLLAGLYALFLSWDSCIKRELSDNKAALRHPYRRTSPVQSLQRVSFTPRPRCWQRRGRNFCCILPEPGTIKGSSRLPGNRVRLLPFHYLI